MSPPSPVLVVLPVLAVFLLWEPAPLRAETTLERTISEESNTFSGDISTAEIATPSEELGDFSVDFSMLDEEDLKITWSAPPGTQIEITRPEGFNAAFFFEFVLETGGTTTDGSFDDTDPSIDYANLTGAAPSTVTRLIRLSGSSLEGAEVSISESLAPGESIQFTSLTASTTVEASYDVNIENLNLTEFSLRGTATGGTTDPGQWIRIINDPTTTPVFTPINPTILQKSRLKRRIKKTKRRIQAIRASQSNQKVRSFRQKLRKLRAKRRAL